jgi:hypothetical protein
MTVFEVIDRIAVASFEPSSANTILAVSSFHASQLSRAVTGLQVCKDLQKGTGLPFLWARTPSATGLVAHAVKLWGTLF